MADLVSVIIPAYNAAATLDETLRSVRSQTHRNLEIIVVDDGSRDETVAIARRHAMRDPRLRVLAQRNGGVAAARNHGIAASSAELVAPVDADDLWAPEKIEKQLAALRAGGERVALVYTWHAVIDAESRITSTAYRPSESGDVLRRMCRGNLVGNGSSPLMRKSAVLEAGGYDASLRARNAQGCEDVKLYFRIAERHHFALVPEFLTGYRQTRRNMSSDALQMLRSWELVAAEMSQRHPDCRAETRDGTAHLVGWLLGRALGGGRWRDAGVLAGRLATLNPGRLARIAFAEPLRAIFRARKRALRRQAKDWLGRTPDPVWRFSIGAPDGAAS
jgi:glycosyltransferase involved in cell wall biosynthesis